MSSFVSIVTPFHNTADYLEQCIRSVLCQSHGDFEYLLCDNASTDGSSELAKKFADQDARIRYMRFDRLLPQVENYNRALELISTDAKYCKVVQADDWLFPACVDKMVQLADRFPEVGVVAAYYLKGAQVAGGGDDPRIESYEGRAVCRQKLLTADFYTGSPTAVMYRADIVRARRPFYPTDRWFEDLDVVYEILEQHALGFVPQILCFQRTDNPSILTSAKSFNPGLLSRLLEVETFSDRFLSPEDARRVRTQARREYFAYMGRAVLRMRERAFWRYHFRALQTIGWRPPYVRLAAAALCQGAELLLNPLDTVRRIGAATRAGSSG